MIAARRGLFITLEGGEGAGKSTAAVGLKRLLDEEGQQALLTREPGGTAGAEAIRALLLGDVPLAPMAQTLLHFAARSEHVERLIRPALEEGRVVICDRFYDSTMAYQAFGQGVAVEAVASLIRLINLRPDISFLLDLPEDIARARVTSRAGATDRYEAMGEAFFARVRGGFKSIAAAEPGRFVLIDATKSPAQVVEDMRAAIRARAGR
jgi:dTMP kinase